MAADNEITRELNEVQGGRITFAPDVIATIASLAAAEVEGVEGMAELLKASPECSTTKRA